MSELKQEHDAAITQLTGPGAPFELGGNEAEGFHYLGAPQTLKDALDAGRAHGDREFLVYEGERRSFSDLFAEADALAAAMQAQGVSKGDRVAIAMRNYPEWMAAFIAIPSIGAVVVPVNSWGQPSDVAFAVQDSGARFVFCDQQRYDGVADIFEAEGIQAIIARPANADDPMGLPSFVADYVGATPEPVAIDTEDLTLIMYTSGTSGKPKGAASTNRAICQAVFNMECNAMASAMTNGETIGAMLEKGFEPTGLLAVPLFHVSGLHAQFLASLRGGRRIVMMYKWDVDKALDYVEQERVTAIGAAPVMILDLLESPRFSEADTDSLFSLGVGGAATPPKIGKLLAEKLPQNFSGTGYGMTESNAQGASFTGKAWGFKPGSSGYPHPIAQFRVCNEHGDELPQGETGEIWLRSCTNVREYWNRPEANAEDFHDGWFKTGDNGYFDEDGFIFLSDRAKDMIIRGGENIYPVEIENELIEHEAVKELAVIGLPHERLGEEVCAVVHLHGTLSEVELLAFAKERLAGFKVPSKVIFTDQPLPRNAANKVLKPLLRKGVLEELGLAP